MATKRGISDMFATMSRDLRLKTEGLPDAVFQVFEEEAETQAEDMKDFVRQRGARTSGPQGRVVTAAMIDSIMAEPKRHSTQLTVKVGYLGNNTNRNSGIYPIAQDQGFDHMHAGWVEGTHAIADAYIKSRERIIARLQSMGLRGKSF